MLEGRISLRLVWLKISWYWCIPDKQRTGDSSKDQSTQKLGPLVQTCQLKIRKIKIVLHDNNIHDLLLQEIDTTSEDDLMNTGKINGYELL